jgi:CHAD domain-containing protein
LTPAKRRTDNAPVGEPQGGDAALFLVEKLRALDDELAATIPRVLASADTEALHDMRVAIRRLRVILKIARPVFGRFHADAVRAELTRVHRATGLLRDEEVLEETLAALPVRDRAFAAWRVRRKARERVLRRAVLRQLREGHLDRARELLHALLALPVKPSRRGRLDKLARRCALRAFDEVEALRDVAPDDVTGMHALRIAYKHLRYAAEIFETKLPLDLAALAKPAARFQKRLGTIHDLDVAMVSVGRARGLSPPTIARVVRALRALRAREVAKYQREMTPALPPQNGTAPDAGVDAGVDAAPQLGYPVRP